MDAMENYYFQGIWRMDWGFGNPNKTAALIALLMIALWALPLVKRWLFWVALPLFAALGVCLVHTLSRGGLVAAVCGLGIVLWRLPRPWPRGRAAAMAVAVSVMLGGAVMLQATARVAQSWNDPSITNRLDIWKAVPRMMVDAPAGWGLGKSGNAYCSWYQALDRHEGYRTLVNSHFTWLVEFGWPVRFLYVFGWLAVLLLCFPRPGQTGFAIALGIWAALLVAALFSSVGECPWVWILPALALLGVLVARLRRRSWPGRLAWGGCVLGCLLLLGAFGLAGRFSDYGMNIRVASNGSVHVGDAAPSLWVLVDPATAGQTYPRALRRYGLASGKMPAVGLAVSAAGLPDLHGCDLVILGARPAAEWQALRTPMEQCQKLTLVAPDKIPAELKLPPELLARSTVLFGEFTRLSSSPAWSSVGVGAFRQIEGVGDFFQDWPSLLFPSLKPAGQQDQ